MDKLHIRPSVHNALAVALALGCALGGTVAVLAVLRLTGQFDPAILVVPVLVATWYGGRFIGASSLALQTVFCLLALPPVLAVRVSSSADLTHLAVSLGVCVLVFVGVAHMSAIERRYRGVVTLALEGIWTTDADGRTTYVNPRMADMLGYTAAEMRGRRFSEFVPQAEVPLSEANAKLECRRQHTTERADCELVRKDGSTLAVHYAGTPLFDGSRFIGALTIVSDITERKRYEATIRRQAEELTRAGRQKDEFLAMLGHELRNPLGPLVAAVTLMDTKSDGSFRRERSVVIRQVEQIVRLVDEISDVSRSMHGKLHLRAETVNVGQLVREACRGVSELMTRKHLTLDVQLPDTLEVQGDELRLRQVVVNLLTNATKYTKSGGHIAVSATGDQDHVLIRVRDNGVGIAPDFMPFLFEPFMQQRDTLNHSEGGLGLGLAIVRNIVQAHGGTVTAHSDGEGLPRFVEQEFRSFLTCGCLVGTPLGL